MIELRLFTYESTVINFDNDEDAERFKKNNPDSRELSKLEIDEIFGSNAKYAGHRTSKVDRNGKITFTLPEELTDIDKWLSRFVRPRRNMKLKETDKYMVSDFPMSAQSKEDLLAYREALRNMPDNLTEIIDTEAIVWPEMPVIK